MIGGSFGGFSFSAGAAGRSCRRQEKHHTTETRRAPCPIPECLDTNHKRRRPAHHCQIRMNAPNGQCARRGRSAEVGRGESRCEFRRSAFFGRKTLHSPTLRANRCCWNIANTCSLRSHKESTRRNAATADQGRTVRGPDSLVMAAVDLPPIFLAITVTPCEQASVDGQRAIEAGDSRKVDAFIDRRVLATNAPVFAGRQSLLSMSTGLLISSVGPERSQSICESVAPKWTCGRLAAWWVDDIRRIAKADSESLTRRWDSGTALVEAIRWRHRSAVQVLLELGSPLSHPDDVEWSDALSDAVDSGDFGNCPDDSRRLSTSELDRVWRVRPFIGKSMYSSRAGYHGHRAAAAHQAARPRDAQWDQGQCLREACLAGNVGTVKLLLAAGAKPDGSSPPDPERFLARWTEFIAICRDCCGGQSDAGTG